MSSSVPLRRSERLRFQASQNKMSTGNLKDNRYSVGLKKSSVQLHRGVGASQDKHQFVPSCRKRGRPWKFIPENENNGGKQKGKDSINSPVRYETLMIQEKKWNPAQLPKCPNWKGGFKVYTENLGRIDGLMAYISNKASKEVLGAVGMLPTLIHSQMFSRITVWPKKFDAYSLTDDTCSPTDDIIDLFFLPESQRSEEAYINCLNHMTAEDLVLEAVIDANVSLLVFTSLQIPYHYWRIHGRYYLWGVFAGINSFFPPQKEDHNSISKYPEDGEEAAKHSMTKRVDECFAEVGECGTITDTLVPEEDSAERSLADTDIGGASKNAVVEAALWRSEMRICSINTPISKSKLCFPDGQEIVPAVEFQKVPQISAAEGLLAGEAARMSDQLNAQIIEASGCPDMKRDLNELVMCQWNGHKSTITAPVEITVPNSGLEKLNEGPDVAIMERARSESIGPSIFHMVSIFDECSDEVSSANNFNERVSFDLVKPSLAPVLQAIINKHGDIAQDCPIKCRAMLSTALEGICTAVQDLETIQFVNLRKSHLDSLYCVINDAELLKLNVQWLRNRYEELRDAVVHIKEYKELKVLRKEAIKEAEAKERELALRKSELALKKSELLKLEADVEKLDSELAHVVAKSESVTGAINTVTSQCKHFRHNSLMEGLL